MQNNTNTRTKGKSRKFKDDYELWKDYLTFIEKHRLENNYDGNDYNKSSTNIYINESYSRIKLNFLCRGEISLSENWDPLKKYERKIKTRMRNLRKLAKNYKTKGRWNM